MDRFWGGMSSQLLTELEGIVDDREKKLKSWPKASNTLTRRLNDLKTNLEEAGFHFETSHSGTRSITLWKSPPKGRDKTVHTVQTDQTQDKQVLTDGQFVDSSKLTVQEPSICKQLKFKGLDDMDGLDDKSLASSGKNKTEDNYLEISIDE